jgi:hypothetical protein
MKAAAVAATALLLFAQSPAAPAQDAGAALVREFLAASGAERQYDQMISIMLDNVRGGMNQGFNQALKDKPLDPARSERARAIAERHFQELRRDLTAEVHRAMPFDRLVSEVYSPLYEKSFTQAELQDLIAFFKSPAGRKFVGATPQLMQDSARIVNERFMPPLVQSMGRQMDQHMKSMVEELSAL